MEKPKPLKQLASPRFSIPKWKWTNVIDLNQTELLSLLREGGKAARQTRNRSATARQIAVSDRHLDRAVRNGELDQQFAEATKQATPRKAKRAA